MKEEKTYTFNKEEIDLIRDQMQLKRKFAKSHSTISKIDRIIKELEK